MRYKRLLTLLTAGTLLAASLPAGVLAANTDNTTPVTTTVTAVTETGTDSGSTENVTIPENTNDVQYADVTVADENLVYTGQKLKPAVTVTLQGKTLTKGTDYKVSYSKNINAGTGTVTVKGKGSYTGRMKKSFTIQKAVQTLNLQKSYKLYRYTEGFSLAPEGLAEGTTVTYKSADKTTAKVKATGEVVPKAYGKTTVTVTAKNDNYKTVKKKVKITFIPDQLEWRTLTVQARYWNADTKQYVKRITAVWEPDDDAQKYQIQISYRKDFEDLSDDKTMDAQHTETGESSRIDTYHWENPKLKTGKKYYIRVRSQVVVNEKTYNGKWSKTKSFYLK